MSLWNGQIAPNLQHHRVADLMQALRDALDRLIPPTTRSHPAKGVTDETLLLPRRCSLAPHIVAHELGIALQLEKVDTKTKRASRRRLHRDQPEGLRRA